MHEVLLSQINAILSQDQQYGGMRIFSDGTQFYLVKFELTVKPAAPTVGPVIVDNLPIKGIDARTLLNWVNEVICN